VVRPFEYGEAISGEAVKPRYRVRAVSRPTLSNYDAPIVKVMAIGDYHGKPGRDNTRALWLARHAMPGSQNDADRPPFYEDLDALDESLSIFHKELPPGQIPITITLGNHEARCERAANKQPKLNGDMPLRRDEIFLRYRWDVHPFGEFVTLDGVDYTHIPLSIMGKEMGGEMMERNVGLKALRSTVCGHTHRANVATIMKVGQQRQVTVVNLGTSMPFGLVERYTGLAPTAWFYGVHELRVRDGQILSVKQFDMLELEERHGN
jgi:hypothetical protein